MQISRLTDKTKVALMNKELGKKLGKLKLKAKKKSYLKNYEELELENQNNKLPILCDQVKAANRCCPAFLLSDNRSREEKSQGGDVELLRTPISHSRLEL